MQFLVIYILLVPAVSGQQVSYVRANNSFDCHGRYPCFTLDQYAEQAHFTTGSTFVFLAGNHIVQTSVRVTNVFDITFKREESNNNFYVRTNLPFFCNKSQT